MGESRSIRARAARTVSPVGQTIEEASDRRARESQEYRDEQARLAQWEQIARIVIRRRMELDLTQQQVAERMGTSHSAISRIENGQHPTKQDTLSRLAEALDMRYVHGFEIVCADTSELELVGV